MVIRPGRAPIRSSGGYIRAALRILRSLGTSARVWAPGASGVSVASLPSNNYLLSNGSTGYSPVDGVDGRTLDGMGALGSELNPDPGFDVPATWTKFGSWAVSGGVASATSESSYMLATLASPLVSGGTYKVQYTISNCSAGGVRIGLGSPEVYSTYSSGNGLVTAFIQPTSTAAILIVSGSTFTGSIDSISVKPYTGIHLTQPTTANKPLVRRGMLNELLNSATPATQSVTCIAAPYTLALYGTGNVVLSGTGAGTLTGTGASDLVVLNFTPTAGSVTFTKAGTVSSFGLFKGIWTAAQILAEGGIPTTTATAASSPTSGKYWWSFDGSNDSLLSGNLGITNACTIVVAGRVNSLAATQVLFAEATNGVQVYLNTSGAIIFSKAGIGIIVITSAAAIVAGVPFVITARLSTGTAVIRNLGVQAATAATALSFTAVTGARIGTDFDGTSFPTNGAIGWVVPIAAALSDADCLTVERFVAAQFPNGPVF